MDAAVSTRPSRPAAALPPRTRTDRDPVAAPDLQVRHRPSSARCARSQVATSSSALGRWHETRRSLVLAYVAGVTGPRRTGGMARQHGRGHCAERQEPSASSERSAAVVPLPALTLDYSAAPADHRGSYRGKEQRQRAWLGRTNPSSGSLATPGLGLPPRRRACALAAAIGGCLVSGAAPPPRGRGAARRRQGPLAVEEPHPSRADSKPAHEWPDQGLKEDAGITAQPDPVPLEARRRPTEAPFGSFTHAVTEEGVPFSFRVPDNGGPARSLQRHLETFSSIPTERPAGGPISLNKSIVGEQDAEAIVFWTSFPVGDYADPCARLWSLPVGSSAADLAAAAAHGARHRARHGALGRHPGRTPCEARSAHRSRDVGDDLGFFYSWRDRRRCVVAGAVGRRHDQGMDRRCGPTA